MTNKKFLIVTMLSLFMGGCNMSSELKNPKHLLPYDSSEFKVKVNSSNIKIADAEIILCNFIKTDKEYKSHLMLYFIYNDSYVFTTIKNLGKSFYSNSRNITKGIDGLYVHMDTGKVMIVERSNITDKYIVLEAEDNPVGFKHYRVNCEQK